MEMLKIIIPDPMSGDGLDVALAGMMPNYSRSKNNCMN